MEFSSKSKQMRTVSITSIRSIINLVTNPPSASAPPGLEISHPMSPQNICSAQDTTEYGGQVVAEGDKEKNGKKGGRRVGVPNYTGDDVDALMDFVEEVLPLGANNWALVAEKFTKWSNANNRPERDAESLRSKFDKLAHMKKPTGDPSCPKSVRRAKHISREKLNKCSASALDSDSEDEILPQRNGSSRNNGTSSSAPAVETDCNSAPLAPSRSNNVPIKRRNSTGIVVSARKNKKSPGRAGVKHKDAEIQEEMDTADEEMTKLIDVLTKTVGGFSQVLKNVNNQPNAGGLTKDDIAAIVQTEVRKELNSAIKTFDEVKAMLVEVIRRSD